MQSDVDVCVCLPTILTHRESQLLFTLMRFAPLSSSLINEKTQKVFASAVCAVFLLISIHYVSHKLDIPSTQRDPQNDWTASQNRVNYDVFAQAASPEREELHVNFDSSASLRTRGKLAFFAFSVDESLNIRFFFCSFFFSKCKEGRVYRACAGIPAF